MSTRAGLYRAWAVATVCWIGGVCFVGQQAVSQHFARSKYIYVPGDPRRYVPYNPPPFIDDGRVVRLDDGSELYFDRSVWKYDDGRYVDPIIEDFWEQRWIRYWIFLRHWLFLIALPGFLFIVVYAMLWVADGFGTT